MAEQSCLQSPLFQFNQVLRNVEYLLLCLLMHLVLEHGKCTKYFYIHGRNHGESSALSSPCSATLLVVVQSFLHVSYSFGCDLSWIHLR